jgi:tetratricopeptide (TPR) repeat protein
MRALAVRPHADPLSVARHARLAGEREVAAAALLDAARVAAARFDPTTAAILLDDAIELDDNAAARVERGRVRSILGRYADADEDIRVARAAGAGADALEVQAWSAHFQRRLSAARALADEGARTAIDPVIRASCLGLAGWVSLSVGDLEGSEQRLTTAVAESGGTGLAPVWLGWLRLNQGRPEETIALARRGEDGTTQRFPNAYARMSAAMAFGMLGMPGDGLRELDQLDADIARMDARRWMPRAMNVRGWILRNMGAPAEADELNASATEVAREVRIGEAWANGMLDLAAGRIVAGDLAAALDLLREVDDMPQGEHAYRWRQELRAKALHARVALDGGDLAAAQAIAVPVADQATALGTPRYALQAGLVAAMAACRLGETVDLDAVNASLSRLEQVAGLEAWWLTADVARTFGVDAWHRDASRRAAQLISRAGPRADDLRKAVSSRLR